MPDDVRINVIPDQQQHSLALMQTNNGNDRSHTSIGVGAHENIPITALLKMVAKMLGVLVCGWAVLVLVQGGMVDTMETKDRVFVTMLFFLVCFRCWRHYCNQDQYSLIEINYKSVFNFSCQYLSFFIEINYKSFFNFSCQYFRSLTETTQSLSADYLSIPNNIQQLALPICYIHRLFYCSRLVSAMTSVVLSVMRLASQDFGKKEVANKESRDFTLKVFYGLTLVEALVLLFAEALSFPIRRNSVGLADGPGDGPEDGPEDTPEDGPVNQSNECNGVAQMDRPANQSNDFNSEGTADSLPNLRQRRREILKVEGTLEDGHAWRKYGQKKILGAKHPRSYYRCTYHHSQGCLATKQVQRTDDNPTVYDVIYQGTHTCIRSDLTEVVSALSATTSATNSPTDDVDPFLTDEISTTIFR